MKRNDLRWGSTIRRLACAVALLCTACGAPPASVPPVEGDPGMSDASTAPPSATESALPALCTAGQTKACTTPVKVYGDYRVCGPGLRNCLDGQWGPCHDGLAVELDAGSGDASTSD